MRKLQELKLPLEIAIFQWFITMMLQIDRLFFRYNSETKYMLVAKVLYLFVLIIVWCFGFDVYKKIKAQNEYYKKGFCVFKTYFCISLLFLLILWPGTWSWDDIWTLNSISRYTEWAPWQHIITGLYQSILLQFLPFPGGVILLQNLIVSVCVAFSVIKLEKIFDIKASSSYGFNNIIKIIPFFLPPVVMYQFSGYRMGLYVYLELVMLVMLIELVKGLKRWSIPYLLLFCIISIIVASWRSESFIYVPFVCLLLLLAKKSVISNKRKMICICVVLIGFIGITKIQSNELRDNNYKIVSLISPAAELVRVADKEKDSELLAAIDKITKLETIYANPSIYGTALYWDTDVMRENYTIDDYRKYVLAVVKLSLRYPKVIIWERWNMFICASGISGMETTNVKRAAMLFEDNSGNAATEIMVDSGWIFNKPIFKNARKNFVRLLGFKNIDMESTILQRIIWNVLIPLAFLVYAWIRLFVEKKWHLWLVCTAVLIRLPIVILTEPSPWIMYLLSFYFLGYVYMVYGIILVRKKYKCTTKLVE